PNGSRPSRASARPRTASRSTGATASRTSTRRAGSSATRRPRSSTRGPARSTSSCRPTTPWAIARTGPGAWSCRSTASRAAPRQGATPMIPDDMPLEFARVVEQAAIAAARTMGQGDGKYADQVAVEAMRKEMETVDIDGTIVIGEGERDEAPMLFLGEKVGREGSVPVDIAADPLEGTNLCATGAANAIA